MGTYKGEKALKSLELELDVGVDMVSRNIVQILWNMGRHMFFDSEPFLQSLFFHSFNGQHSGICLPMYKKLQS